MTKMFSFRMAILSAAMAAMLGLGSACQAGSASQLLMQMTQQNNINNQQQFQSQQRAMDQIAREAICLDLMRMQQLSLRQRMKAPQQKQQNVKPGNRR